MRPLLITLSILFVLPNFFNISLEKIPQYDDKENYDPKLSYINSVDKLIFFADSVASNRKIKQGSLPYALAVTGIISNRFYQGFSHFTLAKNWIAATGELCLGYNLACTVNAQDILQYNYAGCSQQSIVLMEVMKRKNISYRSVGFPHHYALELNLEDKWYYFDPDMEPVFSDSERLRTALISSADSLKKFYDRKHYTDLDWKFGNGNLTLGKVNAFIAPNAKIFQASAFCLSKTLWLFPLIIALYRRNKIDPFQKKIHK